MHDSNRVTDSCISLKKLKFVTEKCNIEESYIRVFLHSSLFMFQTYWFADLEMKNYYKNL